MEREIRGSLFVAVLIFLAVVFGGSMLAYHLFAPLYYSHQKSELIMTAYADLKEMDFISLDDNDEAVFKQYESEDLLFIITDEEFHTLYSSWMDNLERMVYKHVILYKDNFSADPKVINRETRNPMAVKLLGLIEQDGQTYYVNIREKIYAVDETMTYMGRFFIFVLLVSTVAGTPFLYLYFGRILKRVQKEIKTDETVEGTNSRGMEQSGMLDNIRKDLVADISHELKTPLAIISSQVDMLHCMGDQVDRTYYYDSIVEEIGRMSDMVNNLMDLSLMEHRIQKMERQIMDLTDTMEYIRMKYQALFKQSHIRDSFSLESDCKILGNAYYLEQAVDNYMMNALSHTVQGNFIQVNLYRQEGWVWVSVYNQGEKIKDSVMEKIWQGYVVKRKEDTMGDSADPLQKRHMGIGLYLVRRIIQLHQGEYGVENEEKGVRFWFRIPEAVKEA